MKFDGSDKPQPTPFDAHEQVVRNPHTHSQKDGYQPAEYKPQNYPKVIDKDEKGNDVIAASAEHEAAYKAAKAKANAKEPATIEAK